MSLVISIHDHYLPSNGYIPSQVFSCGFSVVFLFSVMIGGGFLPYLYDRSGIDLMHQREQFTRVEGEYQDRTSGHEKQNRVENNEE